MRLLGWLVVVVSCLGCGKRAPALVAPSSAAAAPSVATPPPAVPSPEEVLSKIHWAKVSIDESVAVPTGLVVGYTYDRAESMIGESTAEGVDVQAEIDEADAECPAEIAALPEDERAHHDSFEERSCSEIAIGDVLGDGALTLECGQTGVAYFDLEGQLRADEWIGSGCTGGFGAFDVRELGPNAGATLWVTVTSYGDLGSFDRGGWGFRTDDAELYVLKLPGDGHDAEFMTIRGDADRPRLLTDLHSARATGRSARPPVRSARRPSPTTRRCMPPTRR